MPPDVPQVAFVNPTFELREQIADIVLSYANTADEKYSLKPRKERTGWTPVSPADPAGSLQATESPPIRPLYTDVQDVQTVQLEVPSQHPVLHTSPKSGHTFDR